MAGLAALSAFYLSLVRLHQPLHWQDGPRCTHILSLIQKNEHTHVPSATHASLSRNWPRKAIIGNWQVFGWSVEAAPPLLGSIKATVRWKTCDSVFYVRGAKRSLIHTSLTCCVLKRLLSLLHTMLQRETGARHAFRPKRLHFLSMSLIPERLRGSEGRMGYLLFKALFFLNLANSPKIPI